MEQYLWIIPVAPLVGAIINGKLAALYAHREKGPSERLISFIGVLAPVVSLAVAIGVFMQLNGLDPAARRVTQTLFPWIMAGDLQVHFALMIDPLSMVMVLVVTGIGSLIHLYSVGYMHGDRGFARYFAYLNLFMFSMLVLVLVVGLLHPVFEVRAEEAPAGVPPAAADVPAPESDAAAKTKAAEDSSVEVSLGSGGLKLRTRDGSFKFYFGGRVHADGTYHAEEE